MNILLLGGTGVIGIPLTEMLADAGNEVYVTTRKIRKTTKPNVTYIVGNAKNKIFLQDLTISKDKFDVIIDFMSYSTEEFRQRVDMLLESCKHYIFISSCRVFAESKKTISESSPRVLDTTTDEEYLKTDDYALAKARQEDILRNGQNINYTIIRPSLIYGNSRLQLGAFEKEHWLWRALKGRTIVFSHDMEHKLTAMTHANDVAGAIAAIAGEVQTFGKSYNIADGKSYEWSEILSIYLEALNQITGKLPQVVMTETTTRFCDKNARTQILGARGIDRCFDNSSIREIYKESFTTPHQGLPSALKNFMKNPIFLAIDWEIEALHDKITGENTPLKEIPTIKEKIKYICYRYNVGYLFKFAKKLKKSYKNKNIA